MSAETLDWLSQNTLIGFVESRGTAWHYRQGDDNHYDGPVPVGDVQSRLFNWQAEEKPLYVPATYADGGTSPLTFTQIPERKAIVRSDNGHVMGIFKEGYRPHNYEEWLIKNISTLLDDDLAVGSAGLLKSGAVAWVSVEVPNTITSPEGVAFRPNLIACTSFDGSLATTYKRVVQNVVCDNTLSVALSESGQRFKIKHSRNSIGKISDVREALAIVHTVSDDFMRQVAELTSVKVSDDTFEQIVDHFDPLPKPGENKTTRAITLAEKKRDTLWRLWVNDERVSPWRNTAFGVTQAYNTYRHHESNVRGMERAERNMLNAINGQTEKSDVEVLDKILELSA